MNDRVNLSIIIVFLQIIIFASPVIIPISRCSQNIAFEVIASGDISGYIVEAYFVARTEDQWAEILANHSTPFIHPEQWLEFWENRSGSIDPTHLEEVDFSEKMVICAFMGERRTAGYSIKIEEVWVEDDQIYVEIVKNAPDDDAVATILTYPYIFASIENSEMDTIFKVISEDGEHNEIAIPEFHPLVNLAMLFTMTAVIAMMADRLDN